MKRKCASCQNSIFVVYIYDVLHSTEMQETIKGHDGRDIYFILKEIPFYLHC